MMDLQHYLNVVVILLLLGVYRDQNIRHDSLIHFHVKIYLV